MGTSNLNPAAISALVVFVGATILWSPGLAAASKTEELPKCEGLAAYVSAEVVFGQVRAALKSNDYRTANRLADLGLKEIDRLYESSGQRMVGVLDDSSSIIEKARRDQLQGLLKDAAEAKAAMLAQRIYMYGDGVVCTRG